jgi:hypothetical protein
MWLVKNANCAALTSLQSRSVRLPVFIICALHLELLSRLLPDSLQRLDCFLKADCLEEVGVLGWYNNGVMFNTNTQYSNTPALHSWAELLVPDNFLYPGDYFGRLHNHFFG